MVLNLGEAIKEIHNEKGISEELIISTIQQALTKAYEKYYGTTENLVIRTEDNFVLSMFSKKEVTEDVEDDLFQISLEDAKKIDKKAEIGDLVLVPINPEEFGSIAINSAKQIILQKLKEIEKNSKFSDLKAKQGELIIGYVQRIKNNNIYVDLGKSEGILPKKNQSPLENYQIGDRIKCLVEEVVKTNSGNTNVILTRTSPEFIKKLLEVEIPEIYEKVVNIFKIVREPGYRTKIAVFANRDDIDPVGTCVGQKGIRIQNIIKELYGEKVDVIKWSIDIKKFIENALTPAKVNDIIIEEIDKKAIAIVDDSQFSFAIGKKGLNVKLVNELTGWTIDVVRVEDAIKQGLIRDVKSDAKKLFKDEVEEKNEIEELELPFNIKKALFDNSIYTIKHLIEFDTIEKIKSLAGFNEEMAQYLKNFIDENFEIIEEEGTEEIIEEEGEEEDGIIYYECPNCGGKIREDQTNCPNCRIEIEFEEEE